MYKISTAALASLSAAKDSGLTASDSSTAEATASKIESLKNRFIEHPVVEKAWNDPWASVDFGYGAMVGAYVALAQEVYGETCFTSVLTVGNDMIEWAQRFNLGVDSSKWYEPWLFYATLISHALDMTNMVVDCYDMRAESARFQWYELYPFGQPEGMTDVEAQEKYTDIKVNLIGSTVDQLLEAEGKNRRQEGDDLGNFEADDDEDEAEDEDKDGDVEDEEDELFQLQKKEPVEGDKPPPKDEASPDSKRPPRQGSKGEDEDESPEEHQERERKEARILQQVRRYASRKSIEEIYREMYALGLSTRVYSTSFVENLSSSGWRLTFNILRVFFDLLNLNENLSNVNFYYYGSGNQLGRVLVNTARIWDYYYHTFGFAPIPQWARFLAPEPASDDREMSDAGRAELAQEEESGVIAEQTDTDEVQEEDVGGDEQ